MDCGALHEAQEAAAAAEALTPGLAAERQGVAREVAAMQAALVRLQVEAVGEAGVRQRLARLRASLEAVRGEKALLEGQLTHAEAKVAELRDRAEQREVSSNMGAGLERGPGQVAPKTQTNLAVVKARLLNASKSSSRNLACLPDMQAALRKAQSRCRALEGELAEGQKQLKQQQSEGTAGIPDSPGASGLAVLQARCDELAAELAAAKHQQLEAAAATAAAAADSRELRREVERLQQQLADGSRHAGGPSATEEGPSPAVVPVPAPFDDPALLSLQQLLAERAAQLEQLEFEKAELLVKLEESERQLAAPTAGDAGAAAEQAGTEERQLPAAETSKPEDDSVCPTGSAGSEAGWLLSLGHAGAGADAASTGKEQEALHAAQQREANLERQVRQLKDEVQQLESKAAALQAELGAARAASAGASCAADAADLRRQLQERGQEVADLSALSIKADATVQQYMAQLRR